MCVPQVVSAALPPALLKNSDGVKRPPVPEVVVHAASAAASWWQVIEMLALPVADAPMRPPPCRASVGAADVDSVSELNRVLASAVVRPIAPQLVAIAALLATPTLPSGPLVPVVGA